MIDFTDALNAIQHDGVICYPTEGVWGLGCHPQSLRAFEKLLTIKQRPKEKGVILLAADTEQLAAYVEINDEIVKLFTQYKNEFITFVLTKSANCPDYLSGQFDSVAVRVTNYVPLRELCLRAQTALVSTSANITGEHPVFDIGSARKAFGDKVTYVDMPLGGANKPSKIVLWKNTKMEVIRE